MTNPFGGKSKHGLYVPMTDDELETIVRLAQAGEFYIVVRDWGRIDGFRLAAPGQRFASEPLLVMGDKRLSFYFRMTFSAPVVPQPCWYFDMEVWAIGRLMFAQRLPTEQGGRPIQIAAGMFIDLALDVAIDMIDPVIVKAVKPGAMGLTTRHGNMHLDVERQRLLDHLRGGEKQVRELSAREAAAATTRAREGGVR
jgi:hypothetical protein